MQDPDEWQRRGVHWHAYIATSSDDTARDRAERLDQPPARVLHTPDEVVDWVAERTRDHIARRPIRLLPLYPERWGALGDDEHVERDQDGDYMVASRGDSLYVDIPRQTDRLHLWCESVTADECPEVHE